MLESYRGLHMVIYNLGTIPSLAVWTPGNPEPALRHFLHPVQRDRYIESLLLVQGHSAVARAAYRVLLRLLKTASVYLP